MNDFKMIIKLSQRSNAVQLACHLKSDENECVSIVHINGSLSKNISGVLNDFKGIAKGSKATKYLAHCIISPSPGEEMDTRKWDIAWKVFEKIHGLTGYSNIKVEHDKKNRIHQHSAYNRVDFQTGKAINLSHTHRKNELIARILEIKFGHKLTKGRHNKAVLNELRKRGMNKYVDKLSHLTNGPPSYAFLSHKEHQMQKRGIPINESNNEIAEAWIIKSSTESFLYELANRGFIIAKGKKTPLVISDDQREIPLLRSINAGLKQKKIKRIKKYELDAVIKHRLVSATEAINNYKTIIEKIKKNNVSRIVNSVQPNDIGEINRWKQHRQELLVKLYGEETSKELSQYWKVYNLIDGSLMLQNNSGKIFDRGNIIEAYMDNEELAAKTLVEMAIARKWESVTVSGSDDFKHAHFYYAQENGLRVHIENKHDQEIWDSAHKQIYEKYNSRRLHHRRRRCGLSLQ